MELKWIFLFKFRKLFRWLNQHKWPIRARFPLNLIQFNPSRQGYFKDDLTTYKLKKLSVSIYNIKFR